MNKPLILIVEDDPPIRNLISVALESRGYRFLIAANGSSAILEASSHNPDVMLLDLGLPDLDGVEVIRKLRSWSAMPFIVISVRSDDTDKIEALDAGADDYLTKLFSGYAKAGGKTPAGLSCPLNAYSASCFLAASMARCTLAGAGAPGITRFSTQAIRLRSSNTSASKAGWNCCSSSRLRSSSALFSFRQWATSSPTTRCASRNATPFFTR